MHTPMSTTLTFITEALILLFNLTAAVLNNLYSELTAYTALAYSYWVNCYDAYGC